VKYRFGGKSTDDNAVVYVFAKQVNSWSPWGISFYDNNGTQIYNTNSIPLQMEFAEARMQNLSEPIAIVPSYAGAQAIPLPGGARTLYYNYSACENRLTSGTFSEMDGARDIFRPTKVGFIKRSVYD
jgi:hypothetical protein